MEQVELNLENVLPDHLSIKDIDKDVFDFALIYKHCVDSNEANEEKLLKRRKRKHVFVLAYLIFTAFRLLLCFWKQIKCGNVPDYYFDMIKYFGGLTIFIHLIDILGVLLALRLYYIFGSVDTQDMNWLIILRVLKGISPVKQLSIIYPKDINHFIKIVKLIHSSVENIILIVPLTFLSWCIFILVTLDDWQYVIKYGLISSILFSLVIFIVVHIVYNAIKLFQIIVFYSIFRMKSLNNYTLSLIDMKKISKNKILSALFIYNNTLITISKLNKFWKKVYSTFIYSFLPICLLLLNQLLFETMDPLIFIAMSVVCLSLVIFTLCLNLMSAHIYKEVLKIEKILFTLLKTYKLDTKLKLKVIIIHLMTFN